MTRRTEEPIVAAESPRDDAAELIPLHPALEPVRTDAGNTGRGPCGHTRSVCEIDREDARRGLANAIRSGGAAAAPVVTPVDGEELDDGTAKLPAAGAAALPARGAAPICRPGVDAGDRRVGTLELDRDELALEAEALVTTRPVTRPPVAETLVTTRPITRPPVATTGSATLLRRLTAGALARRWLADAVAVGSTWVTAPVRCDTRAVDVATASVALASAGAACATTPAGVLAKPETEPITVLGKPRRTTVVGTAMTDSTVVAAALTMVAMGATGATVAALTVATIGATVAAALTGLAIGATVVAALTVAATGAAGAVVAALTVAATGPIGAVVAALTVVVAALTGLARGAGAVVAGLDGAGDGSGRRGRGGGA